MISNIPHSVQKQLGFYVYLYIDPRDGIVFYVGKGKGERALSHMRDASESEKVARIAQLMKLGKEPIVEILRYGLTQEQAFHVEAAAIELLGIDALTNRVHGHAFDQKRRTRIEHLVQELDASPVDVVHPSVLININQMYHYGMSPIELYDATRKWWVVGPRRDTARYAMAVYRGIVREVYEIACWLPAGSTLAATGTVWNVPDKDIEPEDIVGDRYEFVGRLASKPLRRRYIGKSVKAYFPAGAQNPIKYAGYQG